jgi:hypothetical protein
MAWKAKINFERGSEHTSISFREFIQNNNEQVLRCGPFEPPIEVVMLSVFHFINFTFQKWIILNLHWK